MSKLRYFPLLFLGLLIGCQQNSDRTPTNSSISVATETQNNIIIKPLSPQPIRINLEDLPPPFHSESASKSPQVIPIPNNPVLNVPPGFKVNIFAENLDNPRWLALTPDGDVLVTETKQNRIRLLKDTNKDGVADQITTFADSKNGLNIPFGMAFSPGYFFLGNTDEVRRYSYNNQQQLTGTGEKIAELPGGGYNQHWTRNVVVSPDNQKLYVSIGSKTNVSQENPPRASIQVMNLDGSNQQTFAYGLRNPVGLDFHPETKELYTTVNERDGLGDDLVPDYFTRIRSGEFYGWPYSYFTPNNLDPRHVQNGQSVRPDLVKKTLKPDVLFQAHSAALGLQFYDGNTFPEPYKKGAFVAFRGSWNRNSGTGYKLVFIPFNQGRPQGYYEEFLTGFLVNPAIPETWGRPVGLLVLPDGSLIFTEESNGRIYRVQYSP
ncbi:L-sorbosone dehydrogenase [Planktothrix agardhii CCAP 1459/11A]|uniref:L-sorbosone dehydrogenase n=1 Tax=Planktothrix agardhii CCAP 1459/11A TaxID=282420 RepID=A0A4V0XU25_PLAAG|nr:MULTISPECIES: sorbosone dehydrogenase family protein [Planktothrix]GDZ92359.1 L-sorbosone dehydrogenase [Planktothrix agardhii CCAP 1459/11A]CAD5956971.1 L-sorbosone dehydrogenase [Planktothrix rubescens]